MIMRHSFWAEEEDKLGFTFSLVTKKAIISENKV